MLLRPLKATDACSSNVNSNTLHTAQFVLHTDPHIIVSDKFTAFESAAESELINHLMLTLFEPPALMRTANLFSLPARIDRKICCTENLHPFAILFQPCFFQTSVQNISFTIWEMCSYRSIHEHYPKSGQTHTSL